MNMFVNHNPKLRHTRTVELDRNRFALSARTKAAVQTCGDHDKSDGLSVKTFAVYRSRCVGYFSMYGRDDMMEVAYAFCSLPECRRITT
jgi:hypothetical protein